MCKNKLNCISCQREGRGVLANWEIKFAVFTLIFDWEMLFLFVEKQCITQIQCENEVDTLSFIFHIDIVNGPLINP